MAEDGAPQRTVAVVGRGSVEAQPDVAEVVVGVDVVRPAAGEARAAAAVTMERIVEALLASGLSPEDVRTSNLSLAPEVEYQPHGPPRRTGFRLTNRATARVRRLDDVARIVDAAVEAGATAVDGVTFRVADERASRQEALSAAVADARAAAESVAAAAGVRLGPVRSVRELAGGGGPGPQLAMLEARAPETPVLPGLTRVEAVVEVSFEIDA